MQNGLEEVFEHTDSANARAAVQGLMMNLSQGDLAKAAGVSVSTVHKFETGTITNMNVTNLMALLRPVGLLDRFDDLIPEQPANPYLTTPEHQQQRVRRKNNG